MVKRGDGMDEREGGGMTVLQNDDFDMCCGNRPQVTHDPIFVGKEYMAQCGVCSDYKVDNNLTCLMIRWNKSQREKAGEGEA